MASIVDRELAEKEIVDGVNVEYAQKYGFSDVEDYVFKAEKGLNEEVIRQMSWNRDRNQQSYSSM